MNMDGAMKSRAVQIVKMGSEKRFSYSWSKYPGIIPEYEKQFLRWTSLILKSEWKGKMVLDAGIGTGRNSYWVIKYGAKKIVGFDNDRRIIQIAYKNLEQFGQRKLVFPASIYNIDWENKFDIVMCIGVIHHLQMPSLAIDNLVKAAKPGGKILIWVYGYEGNEWIVKYINPIRKITSRLPIWMTHLISYKFSIPLWIYLKLFPQKSPYMKQIKKFKFYHLHSIVFDQLLPKIARYYTKEEAELLLEQHSSIKDVQIKHVNNNSWQVMGIKQ